MPGLDHLVIRQLALEIFGGCTFKCCMCPQAQGREREFLKKLPFEVFRKIIDDALDYGLEVVSVHGSGEATLYPDMPKFVEFVKSRSLTCITTGAVCIGTYHTNGNVISAGAAAAPTRRS